MLDGIIKNKIETSGLRISLWLRLRLMVSPIEECQALLKAVIPPGTWVYTGGSHHVAVIRDGGWVLRVKDKAYC